MVDFRFWTVSAEMNIEKNGLWTARAGLAIVTAHTLQKDLNACTYTVCGICDKRRIPVSV